MSNKDSMKDPALMCPVVAIAAMLLFAGCGESTLTATEYRDLLVERSAAYAQEAEDIRVSHLYDLERTVDDLVKHTEADELQAAVLAETSRRSATLFASIGDAVQRYSADLARLDPPVGLLPAHLEFVAALELSIAGIGATVGALAAATSFQEIEAAIGGSTFNDTQHRVDAACAGLERSLAELGVPADLRCREV